MALLPGWPKYFDYTLDGSQITSALTNFAFPIPFGSSVGIGNTDTTFVFDEIGANFKKMAFTVPSVSDTQECYAEKEFWDASAKEGVIWVKCLSLPSPGNPIVRIYYGANHADNTPYIGDVLSTPALSVWNSDVAAAYNMAQDPNGDAANSILNSKEDANHGTPVGSMTSANLVDSDMGKAIDFDGVLNRINLGTGLGTALGDSILQIQIDMWIKMDDVSDREGLFSFNPLNNTTAECDVHIFEGVYKFFLNGTSRLECPYTNISDWIYVTARWDGVNAKIYFDGVEQVTIAYSDPIDLTGIQGNIGAFYSQTLRNLDGKIGHVRIYNTTQSDAWIKATAAAFNDNFGTFGTEQLTTTYEISGDVKKENDFVARKVWLIKEGTPEIVNTTDSDEITGAFSFTGLTDQGPYVIYFKTDAEDTGYRDLTFPGVMGVEE